MKTKTNFQWIMTQLKQLMKFEKVGNKYDTGKT